MNAQRLERNGISAAELERLKTDWDDLAQLDPMWAICSSHDRQFNNWDVDEFFAQGRRQVLEMLTLVSNFDTDVTGAGRKALDFGCGIGRITQGLCDYFGECYGVDIAPTMVALAERLAMHNRPNCHFVLNDVSNLSLFADCSFDFVVTTEVLQHIQPSLMENYIGEFLRVLKFGGILLFDIPIARISVIDQTGRFTSLPYWHPRRILTDN